jgi:hypothetical protein
MPDRDDIFNLTIGNESNYKGVGVINFDTSKNLIVKSTMFPHCNIHILGRLQMGKPTIRLTIF